MSPCPFLLKRELHFLSCERFIAMSFCCFFFLYHKMWSGNTGEHVKRLNKKLWGRVNICLFVCFKSCRSRIAISLSISKSISKKYLFFLLSGLFPSLHDNKGRENSGLPDRKSFKTRYVYVAVYIYLYIIFIFIIIQVYWIMFFLKERKKNME